MKRLSILRRAGAVGLAGAVLVGAGLVAVGLTATPALADTTEPPLFSGSPNGNSSDPEVHQCSDQASGWSGLCMFTTHDLGVHGPWWYPMDKTYLYTLDNGLDPSVPDNWQRRGTGPEGEIFNENQLVRPQNSSPPDPGQPGPFVPEGAKHLWAPTHVSYQGSHYLLVPDVTHFSEGAAPNVHTSSRIAIATSTSLFGPYTFQKTYNINEYASDPAVYVNTGGHNGPSPYLVYADGDGDTCGGLTIAQLAPWDITTILGTQPIAISGLAEEFGTEGAGCGDKGRPYLEGAALYNFSASETGSTNSESFYLVFAVKPEGGRHGRSNEVIAYATSISPSGPFTYRGIIMEGSDSEWTNQASIEKWRDRWIFAYHDGTSIPDPVDPMRTLAMRKVRGACLTFHEGKISPIYRTPDGFARCMAIKDTIALRSRGNGKVVVAYPEGFGVSAANPNIGLWEKFDVIPRTSGRISLRAHSNGMFVTADDSLGGLRANAADVGGAAEFALQFNANGSVSLGHPWGGFVAPTTSTGALLKDNTPKVPTVGREFDIVPLNGGFYGLRTAAEEHRFVTAPNGSQSPLVASGGSGTSVAWEERFTFDFETTGEGRARLRWTAPDFFVCADLNRSSEHPPVIADRFPAREWETFTLLWNADGTFSLRAVANNKFVAAPPTWFGGSLVADRDAIGPWEKFDLVTAGSGVAW